MADPIVDRLLGVLPTMAAAVRTIMASDSAHTLETAIAELCRHNTPGEPDSPVLAGSAPSAQAAPPRPDAPSGPGGHAP